ncbi:MAG: tRNA pseudouridine(38-40) synthase TruA [Mogibacterium sp.]|nr:tRNA pseudouridine(38-40) synthase TruA [Mogibacterium sp.]
MDKNILLVIEYDGTDFHGWQKQPGERTVQGEIEHVLKYIAGQDVAIHGTSRTDSGVHALGQCASFHWDCPIPTERLAEVMNRRFGAGGTGRSGAPGDIRILEAREVAADFHARFSCIGKTYRYVIDRGGNIFDRHHVFHFNEALAVDAMRRAAEHIVGTHDFKSFETAGGIPRETTVRTVHALTIDAADDRVTVRVTGDGFLYNMVRIMVGTLVEVGTGRREPDDVAAVLEARDRSKAGFTAPPQGLYLERIYFDERDLWQSVTSQR